MFLTEEKPTKLGWYWAELHGWDGLVIAKVYSPLAFSCDGRSYMFDSSPVVRWSNVPIPEPTRYKNTCGMPSHTDDCDCHVAGGDR